VKRKFCAKGRSRCEPGRVREGTCADPDQSKFGRDGITEASPSRHKLYVTVTKLGLGTGWEESVPSGLISPLCEQNFRVSGHISNTATHESQRRNIRTSRPSGGGDGDSFPSTSIPCTMPALPCRRLRTTQGGPPFHATAHAIHAMRALQCVLCKACIACMACATGMPRKACVTRSDRTMLLCTKSRLPAQIKMLSQVHVSER